MSRAVSSPSPQQAAEAWSAARAYAHHIASGNPPPTIGISGLILQPGEHANFQTAATYERLYGGDGTYYRSGFFAFGNPAFVLGAAAASIAVNARRGRAASERATVMWRERQESPVVATDRRLLIATAAHGWLSFWYSGIQEFYPEPTEWLLVAVWPDTAPVRLSGLAAPYLAAHIAAHIVPREWVSWPQLGPLVQG